MRVITIDGITLVQTSKGMPEQYDAFRGPTGFPEQVGYLRLRYGHFRVDFPDCGGKTIFEGAPKGYGEFYMDERMKWLRRAVREIREELGEYV